LLSLIKLHDDIITISLTFSHIKMSFFICAK